MKQGEWRRGKSKSLEIEVSEYGGGCEWNEGKGRCGKDEWCLELRYNILLYRNEEHQRSEMGSVVDDKDIVPFEELLAEIKLSYEDENEGLGNAKMF